MIEPLEEESDNKNRTKSKKILSDIKFNRKLIYTLYIILLFFIIFIFYTNYKINNNELFQKDLKSYIFKLEKLQKEQNEEINQLKKKNKKFGKSTKK